MSYSPIQLVREGVRAVPAVRYAVGVGGITAIVAIISAFKVDLFVSFIGTLIVLVLMFVLVIFANAAKTKGRSISILAVIGLIGSMTMFFAVCVLLITSLFFKYPVDIEELVKPDPYRKMQGRLNALLALEMTNNILPKYVTYKPPLIEGKFLDGCVDSLFFPGGYQCSVEAQKVVADYFCRINGHRRASGQAAQMYPTIHPALKLKLNEAPSDRLDRRWLDSPASGFVFDEISCE